MMKPSQDQNSFYRTAHTGRDRPGDMLGHSRQERLAREEWHLQAARNRRKNLVLSVGLLLLIFIVITGSFYLYFTTARPVAPVFESAQPAEPSPPADSPAQPSGSAEQTDLGGLALINPDMPLLSMDEVLLIERLREVTPQSIPEGGDMPLDTTWIKQAALHIIEGERLEEEGMHRRALMHLRRALLIYPDLEGVRQRIGLLHLQLHNYEEAARAFETAAAETLLSPGIANNLGVAYMKMGSLDKALDSFLHALRLRPDYPACEYNLATLYLQRGEMRKAADAFARYLEAEPGNQRAAYSYAYTLIKTDQWEEAITVLKRLQAASPESAPILFRLAQAQANNGQPAQALDAIRQGLKIVDFQRAYNWLTQSEFDPLRGHPDFVDLMEMVARPAQDRS